MITSKLTRKAQTTIRQPVRTALRLTAVGQSDYEIVRRDTNALRGRHTVGAEWTTEHSTR